MTIWTVGHSNQTFDEFIQLLQRAEITAIADVRSQPYSKYTPQFNREVLKTRLSEVHIQYVFLGDFLGARPEDDSVYISGRVNFSKLVQTSYFQKGLGRLKAGAEKQRLAIMCSEKDPIQCHRMGLIGHELRNQGVDLRHILGDGSIEHNNVTEDRLRHAMGVNDVDLFRSQEELIEDAYSRLAIKIAASASEKTTTKTHSL